MEFLQTLKLFWILQYIGGLLICMIEWDKFYTQKEDQHRYHEGATAFFVLILCSFMGWLIVLSFLVQWLVIIYVYCILFYYLTKKHLRRWLYKIQDKI